MSLTDLFRKMRRRRIGDSISPANQLRAQSKYWIQVARVQQAEHRDVSILRCHRLLRMSVSFSLSLLSHSKRVKSLTCLQQRRVPICCASDQCAQRSNNEAE